MDFNTYQKEALKTAVYPNIGGNVYYPVLGLCGEAGELANKVKKVMRDHQGVIGPEMVASLWDEVGDLLWYISAIAFELRANLGDLAQLNLDKLKDRADRGVIKGEGDKR